MEDKIVVANMKMNMYPLDIDNYLKVINEKVKTKNVIICPTSIYIPYFLNKDYSVGIQNIYYQEKGAYTGEISPVQAVKMGISYAVLGHSERRILFKEDDLIINKKVISAIKNNLKVILCIGETNEEKSLLKTEKVLKRQIRNCLKDIDLNCFENIYIAYEPVWAIGSNIIPSNNDIQVAVSFIKNVVFDLYKKNDIKVLYGGSINDMNIKELNEIVNLSGFLVGGASLDVNKFLNIVEVVVGQ